MTADEWGQMCGGSQDEADREYEREHDCCPRCGRGSCPGSGSLGWDGCENPVWISVTVSACMDCDPPDRTVTDRCQKCEGPSPQPVCSECRYWATLEGQPVIPAKNDATR